MLNYRRYTETGGNATYTAQRNLSDRTHYVDADTLRFHKSTILQTAVVDDGLLFAMIESVALDWGNTRRGFRYVVFDIFGTVISRVSLEDCWKSRQQARKAMWAFLNAADAKAITLEGIERAEKLFAYEIAEVRKSLDAAKAA